MILGAICIATLFSARIGIYGYLWYSLMRPDVLAWASPKNDIRWFSRRSCCSPPR